MLTNTLTMSKPTLRSHSHLQFAQANAMTKNCKRVCLHSRTDTATLDGQATTEKEGRTHNTRLDKKPKIFSRKNIKTYKTNHNSQNN